MPVINTTRLPDGAKYSAKRANRAVNFIERCTVHTKSVWAGRPFTLYDWQAGHAIKDTYGEWTLDGIIRPMFGAVQWSDHYKVYVRQYDTTWMEMARKNGKSELLAAFALYFLIADGEWSAEIYGAASDKNQASMVFNVARDMIKLSPFLSKMEARGELEIIDSRKTILYKPTMSVYKVVSADAGRILGANPYAVLFDEVLEQPNRKLWDYLKQGFGTRPNQMLVAATTAGPNRQSFAYGEHEKSITAASDPNSDPSRLVYIAMVPEGADWRDETLWPDANPAAGPGKHLDLDILRREANAAATSGDLSQIANFKIFRLNQWGESTGRWLDMAVYDDSEVKAGTFDVDSLDGVRGVGGLDLAETTDLAAWVMVFYEEDTGRVLVKPHFWITRKAIREKHKKMLPQFLKWEDEELLTVFERDVHDYDAIRDHIYEDISQHNIEYIGYDQYQAPSVINFLEARTDITAVKIPQTTTRMNAGAKELVRAIGARQFTANQNPILRWNADNTIYKMDNELNIKPDKKNSLDNIDGVTSLVNAMTVAVTVPESVPLTMYVFEQCPVCGDDEISIDENTHIGRCRECGHNWRTA